MSGYCVHSQSPRLKGALIYHETPVSLNQAVHYLDGCDTFVLESTRTRRSADHEFFARRSSKGEDRGNVAVERAALRMMS